MNDINPAGVHRPHRNGDHTIMRGLLGVLLVTVTALVAGFIGYLVGISSAVATTAATAGTVVYHVGWGFGFPWFGFLLFPFFLFLLFGFFAFAFGGRRRWAAERADPVGATVTAATRAAPTIPATAGSPTPTAGSTRTRPRAVRRRPRRPRPATRGPAAGRLTSLFRDAGRVCSPGVASRVRRPMRTILVAEDEPQIAGLVRDYLEHAGFAVITAADGAAALALARARRPDAMVLDLGLPRVDGLDVIRAIRHDSRVPILILSARGDEIDRVTGLELGADDYVVKPFSPRELVARVRAVLRRAEAVPLTDERIVAGDLELDLVRRRVSAAGRVVNLTPTEFELLATLAREPGRVWTRSQLLDAVHGFSLETYERAIDGHIRNLRRKLEPDDASPKYVRTVHGVGYALAEPEG